MAIQLHCLRRPFGVGVMALPRRLKASFSGRDDDVPLPKKGQTFIDSLRMYVRGGPGGQGLAKYGGIGGKGGDVVVRAKGCESLVSVRRRHPNKRLVGGAGANSTRWCLRGDDGPDCMVVVPPGVEVLAEDGRLIGDLDREGDAVVAVRGGRGGCHNNAFVGRRGEAQSVTLNLKLIADVGLVGFPNAGKSTFLKAVSRATPKVASYPFTTLRPQVGMVDFPDGRRISVADLPGLVEGAHANFGLGHRFLKHVERTRLLLLLVDVNGFQLSPDYPHRPPLHSILLLNRELELYRPELLTKPAVLVLTKADTDPGGQRACEVMAAVEQLPQSVGTVEEDVRPQTLLQFDEVLTMSAQEGTNVRKVMDTVRAVMDAHADRRLVGQRADTAVALQGEGEGEESLPHTREQAKRRLV